MAKILIVDDNVFNRKLLTGILESCSKDYECLEAETGKKAIEMVEKNPPDMILLDVMMPDIDGFETCRRLKESKKNRSIPVIFVTALQETGDLVKGLKMGGADYIPKPIKAEEVRARVTAHLRIKQAEEERVEMEGLRTVKDMVVTYNHNMNQPLMVTFMYLETLVEKFKEDEKTFRILKKMKNELTRVKEILEKIQNLDTLQRVHYVDERDMIEL